MRIILVTDFPLKGSGYQTLSEGLALGLFSLGHKVTVLGTGYQGEQHPYPFQLIPTHYTWIPQHITVLVPELKPDWIFFLMDIPRQVSIAEELARKHPAFMQDKNIAAIFPIESDPLCSVWKNVLGTKFKKLFTFTDFGIKTLEEAGIKATKIPVCMVQAWYEEPDPAHIEEYIVPMTKNPYILTVADNQIRKNLPAVMETIGKWLKKNPESKLYWVIVTLSDGKDGWWLPEICDRVGFPKERLIICDMRHTSRAKLKALYDNAVVFLTLPLAEGIGLPIYEAQACGCPVVGTNCTGIPEALEHKELAVSWKYKTIYPWGYVNHYWADTDDAVEKLDLGLRTEHIKKVYPRWTAAAEILMNNLD